MTIGAQAVSAAKQAMGLVCISLPHLSGLAHAVRIAADDRVATAGIFASGRLVVNPRWFLQFNDVERTFVLAHELLHLALHTHHRSGGSDHELFNVAHDLIINDILEAELGIPPPDGGLRSPGARDLSTEALVLEASRTHPDHPETALGAAFVDAFGYPEDGRFVTAPDDVLDGALERRWYPDEQPTAQLAAVNAIRAEATRSLALQRVQEQARKAAIAVSSGSRGSRSETSHSYVEALTVGHQPPWELALHRWLDCVTTPRRTYVRASRRGADRTDIVLPGRDRDAQTLTIVLDTSGSMTGEIAHALGSIMTFGRGAGVDAVRIVQCDNEITGDDIVWIDELAAYRVSGFGGSDMSPALTHLASDPAITAVLVITDGVVDYPPQAMPFEIMWMIYRNLWFTPSYGQIVRMSTDGGCNPPTGMKRGKP